MTQVHTNQVNRSNDQSQFFKRFQQKYAMFYNTDSVKIQLRQHILVYLQNFSRSDLPARLTESLRCFGEYPSPLRSQSMSIYNRYFYFHVVMPLSVM